MESSGEQLPMSLQSSSDEEVFGNSNDEPEGQRQHLERGSDEEVFGNNNDEPGLVEEQRQHLERRRDEPSDFSDDDSSSHFDEAEFEEEMLLFRAQVDLRGGIRAQAEALLEPRRGPNIAQRLDFGIPPHNGRQKLLTDANLIARLQPEVMLQGHRGCVNTLEWSPFDPAGTLLLSGSDDTTLKLWRDDGVCLATLRPGHLANVYGGIFLSENLVASCDRSGLVGISDIETQKLVMAIRCHCGQCAVKRLCRGVDENSLYCCTGNGSVLN